MSLITIVTIAIAIATMLAVLGLALYISATCKQASSHFRNARWFASLAETSSDWHDFHKAQFAYKRSARLYMRAGQYPTARHCVRRMVEMRRAVDARI